MENRDTTRAFYGLISALALACLAGCRGDDITSTWVAKESAAPAMPTMPTMPAGMDSAPVEKDVAWTLPKGWVEQPASAMRLGSFLIKNQGGHDVDVSIVPLSGEAGGTLANINRWRGQINLSPIGDADVASVGKTIHPAGREMLMVDFVSEQPLVDNQFRKRIVAAIYERGGQTWFFKMVGEDKAVSAAKTSFVQFLSKLKFNQHE